MGSRRNALVRRARARPAPRDVWGRIAKPALGRLSSGRATEGGLGIVIGDGQLPHPGLEQIIETYNSYAISGPIERVAAIVFTGVQKPAQGTKHKASKNLHKSGRV
jgi:hypothetical protein